MGEGFKYINAEKYYLRGLTMNSLIKKIITKPEKIFYGFQKIGLMDWMNDEIYIKFSYKMIYGRKLNLENPKAYTEQLAWLKLNWRSELAIKCADKYQVREYVRQKLGDDAERYLNKIYGVYENINDIDFDMLPDKFVIKPTNGSGDVVICENKDKFDFQKEKKKLLKNKKKHFSNLTKEWVYDNLPQRFLIEKFIESSDGKAIKDYKFFCFHGEPKFLFVCSERDIDPKFDFYDLDWNPIPVINGHERLKDIQKPEMFEEMINLSRYLSEDFPHVRVDLYQENGRIYFGELTFFHFGGFTKFEPDSFDFEFGKYLNIDLIKSIKDNQ